MSSLPLRLVRSRSDQVLAAYRAIDRGEVEASLLMLHPDVISLTGEGDERRGVAAVAAAHRRLRTAFPDLVHRVEAIIEAGDHTVAQAVVHATHQGVWETHPATGRTVHIPVCDVYRWRDQRVIRLQRYWDRQRTLEQIGLG